MADGRIILRSSCIYDSVSGIPYDGYIEVEGNHIKGIYRKGDAETCRFQQAEVIDLGDRTICAGLGDTHTFFTGYYINKPGVFEEMVDEIPGYLRDKEQVKNAFCAYMAMLNRHGITSIKEMTFDESYGLKEILAELEQEGRLTLRVAFMSQPVKDPANIAYGIRAREQYHSEFLRFSGFNQMTDGLIVAGEGDLLEPYEGSDQTCGKAIDYETIRADVLAADRAGLRFTLHSEGDGAFHKILDIYEACERDENGRLQNRHGITDLELTTAADRQRMAGLGVFGEAYLQMLGTDDAANWIQDVTDKVGGRFDQYLNMRGLADAGVTIAAATDLPFLIPDVPESIYHGTYANAAEGTGKVNEQNALTIAETLNAWTIGAQYAMERENILGTLEAGKLADLVVFDRNLFQCAESEVLHAAVTMTMVNGTIVYRGER